MEILIGTLLLLLIALFLIVWFNFVCIIFIKIRISRRVEEIKASGRETVKSTISPFNVFRLIENTPVLNEVKNESLNVDIVLYGRIKRRLKKYGILFAVFFIIVFALIKLSN